MSCKNLSILGVMDTRELFANKCKKPRNNGLEEVWENEAWRQNQVRPGAVKSREVLCA